MQVVSKAETRQKTVKGGHTNDLWSYYGEAAATCAGPQVFLVEVPEPDATIEPHFHDVVQVIVRGCSRLGRDAAGPAVFHYADAYTPYGPIVGSEAGMSFFTIRAACASGYYPMPGARHMIQGKPGRNLAGKFDIDKPLPKAGESTRETMISAEDGVKVVGLSLGPNAHAEGEPADAGDQFYLVFTGSVIHDGREAPPLTLVRVEPGEATPIFHAGPAGARLLLTQMPRATSRPGSDTQKLAERQLGQFKLPDGAFVE
jgi:hypothetical protein